ncbi:Gfo/Idh/MocA family oxidoreductase [bacterium]|nr:Gfo/Idh/MocA family oxidoreductase [bacterium]
MKNLAVNRRSAFQAALLAGAGGFFTGGRSSEARGETANEKLNLACIGVGGRGSANVNGLSSQNLVAFVDVDDARAGGAYTKYPNAERFKDFRKMLDQWGSKLDGVVISTPDHAHFHPAFAAMQLGLHVYLEKPLAHNVWETRTLTNLAKEKNLATQLGAQRHAMDNMHRVVELVQSGAIGRVSEVHSWVGGSRGMPSLPSDRPAVPSSLDYDLWVGPAKYRPYHPSHCPYGWRFWWDYGTGETGNWGCHILDIPFWALGLKYPQKVEASGPETDSDRTPKSMTVKYQFNQTNQGSNIDLHWYHGTPSVLKELGLSAKGNNTLFIGEKGNLLCGFSQRALLPEDRFANYSAPDAFIEDSPGFHREWIEACKGGAPATCNFDYSGPLAETVLLGNVAYRGGGFNWNAENLRTEGNEKTQRLIQEPYRKGWEIAIA